jgi:hypothetical protein
MSDLITEARGLDIGRALGDAFQVVGRRWPTMVFVVLAIGWIPQVVLILAYYPVVSNFASRPTALVASTLLELTMLFVAVFMRLSITAAALIPQAEVSTPRALTSALGATPALAPLWLVTSAPNIARAVMANVLHASLAQQAQVVALIAWPLAVALALIVGVASSVAVAERRGFLGTMARAARLMSAGRWAFFGLFLVFQLLAGLSTFAVAIPFGLLRTSGTGEIRMFGVARTILTDLGSDCLQAMWAVVAAMCYRQFRRQLDGPTADEAADIFS